FKRIAFLLNGFKHFSIAGEGAEFVFHGRIVPFVIERCRDVRIENIRVDWERTFTSEGTILDSGDGFVDVAFSTAYPYRIRDGQVVFWDDEYFGLRPLLQTMEWDARKREVLPDATDYYTANRAEELASGHVRLRGPYTRLTPGNVLTLKSENRYCPAIAVSDSADVELNDVTLHHAGGMGVIAQNSADLRLHRLVVTPHPDSGRMISVTDDAIHAVNCSGAILIDQCRCGGMWDDGVNIHGIYRSVFRRTSANALLAEARHFQQLGIEIAGAGDRIEFVDPYTLATVHEARLKAVMPLTRQLTQFTFAERLPALIREGYAMANLDRTPAVTIRNSTFRGNKPRGVLVTTPRRVVIEDNTIHTPGAAIYIAGDASAWFESGAVRDLTIRRNLFDNCKYMARATGLAVIDIDPKIESPSLAAAAYHRNIRITDNRFRSAHTALIHARSVAGLRIADNICDRSGEYPPLPTSAPTVDLDSCEEVTVDNNRFPATDGSTETEGPA
ncbi:MAG: right-handed parallel beta-helix repeat-containing protein, partial [Kiritimatiellae bacterium]|nr:right-handed parallel beta-helix repeat-containing protein [Kiritimatiellia bacterium]